MTDYMQGNPDNAIQVPFSDDETEKSKVDDDLGEDPPGASPEERKTRSQRRTERINRMLQEGKQSKEELAALKAEQAAAKAELERLKGYLAAKEQQERRPANDNAKDPYTAQLDAIYKEQSETFAAYQAAIKANDLTPERQKHFEEKARGFEERKTEVITQKALAQHAAQQRQQQGRAVWEQKYPEVYNHDRAFKYAQSTYEARKALGEEPTAALAEEIFEEARVRFKLGGKPAPTASEKSRMSGVPSAGSGSGGKPAGVTLSPHMQKMAEAAYSHLPQAEAHKAWANRTGKKLREKKVI